jgi:glycosyltransferase involved in cell wall biosynthesis
VTRELVLVANARMPSQRAQSLQVAQVAASFQRAGHPTTLLHARRRDTPVINADALWDHYSVPEGPRPQVRALACTDWIDRVPRRWQYLPARVQELTFSMSAAREVLRKHKGALVLSRELEAARALVRKGLQGVFLEVHRVPGGNLRRKWLREAVPKLAGVIAISGGVRGDLIELGVPAGQILVAHDGFEPARFAGLPDKRVARDQLGLDQDRPLVVYTGGLLEWKGVELLVESARALPDVQVVVAGGMTADVKRIERLGAGLDNLRVDGFQPPDRIGTYLAAADIGVVPNRSTPAISARYTSPLKVFEAMAVGLPLVVSDLPSMREILSHDVDAWLVQPDSAAELTRGIQALLDDPDRRARLGKALAAHGSNYDWDARARRMLDWMLAR